MRVIENENTISTKELEDVLGIPANYIYSYLNINEDIGNEFVKKYGKGLYLTLKGVLKHLPNLTKNYDYFNKVVDMFYNNSSNYEEEYNAIIEKYNCLVEKVKLLTDAFSNVVEEEIEKPIKINENISEVKPSKNYVKNTDLLPEKTEAEKKWCDKITKISKEKAKKNNLVISTLMRKIYTIMRNEYGIVFEQDKKNLRDIYEIDDDAHISTLYVVATNEKYRSIYESILETRY